MTVRRRGAVPDGELAARRAGLTCEAVARLAEAFALGALGPGTIERVATHLRACPACRHRSAPNLRVAAALALAPPQVTPPAALKMRLLAAATA